MKVYIVMIDHDMTFGSQRQPEKIFLKKESAEAWLKKAIEEKKIYDHPRASKILEMEVQQ